MLEDCKFWRPSLGERAYTRLGVGFENFESLQWINISKKTLYCSFLWIGCNCLKTAESTSRGFTFNQLEGVPPYKDERLSRPLSHPRVFNLGPLDWDFSATKIKNDDI